MIACFGPSNVLATEDEVTEDQTARILAIGDSLMAWHTLTGLSIPDIISRELEEPTANRSIGGARLLFKVPFLGDMPLIGPMLFTQNLFVYGAFIIVLISVYYLFFTRHGLRCLAVRDPK